MNCFVTGATGFIGGQLVLALLKRGFQVRALARNLQSRAVFPREQVEWVEGDFADPALLSRALKGCQWCFHVGASYHLWLKDYRPMYAANVHGTQNVLRAAAENGCARIVYTSTVGCIGLPEVKNGKLIPTDESAPMRPGQLSNDYKRSKWQAEEKALELARQGAPIVVVNPSAPVGPGDLKPTPTGQIIVDFLNRRLPAFLETGLNWVHVGDVAEGHILAAERGKVGERYILGNSSGNWTLRETFAVLEELTGIPGPKVRIPYAVAWGAAIMDEAMSKITGRPPRAPLAGVRMAKYKMFFNPERAVWELGLPQTPPRQALAEAVAWFRENGYVQR